MLFNDKLIKFLFYRISTISCCKLGVEMTTLECEITHKNEFCGDSDRRWFLSKWLIQDKYVEAITCSRNIFNNQTWSRWWSSAAGGAPCISANTKTSTLGRPLASSALGIEVCISPLTRSSSTCIFPAASYSFVPASKPWILSTWSMCFFLVNSWRWCNNAREILNG